MVQITEWAFTFAILILASDLPCPPHTTHIDIHRQFPPPTHPIYSSVGAKATSLYSVGERMTLLLLLTTSWDAS